jgi:ribonuclease P protein component
MVAGSPCRTLQKNEQFRVCYSRGKKVVCEHIVVFYHPVRSDGAAVNVRIGVVASKRVGNAVKRNRAKRLLRDAARHVCDRLNYQDIWVVLVAKSTITTQTSHVVRNDLEQGLRRGGLLESANT